MYKMKFNQRNCQRIQNQIMLFPDQDFSGRIKKHILECPDCSRFLAEEKWIRSLVQKSITTIPEIPNEKSLQVKQAIWEVSKELTAKKQSRISIFPKLAGLVSIVSLILVFFLAPVFKGETFYGFRINNELARFIINNETVAVTESGDKNATETLKFASIYVETPEEKSFYYSTNSLSRENYLMVKYLARKTKTSVEQIFNWFKQGGYAYLFRRLNLPFGRTSQEIQKYISQFRQSKNLTHFSLDGSILWIDYKKDIIWIDSYNQEIIVDNITLDNLYIGYYANFLLQEKDNQTFCLTIEESSFPTTVLTGTLDTSSKQEIRLVGNPSPILVTAKTIFNSAQTISKSGGSENLEVRIRAMVHENKMTAITITPILPGSKRSLSGKIDQAFQYGLTLQNLTISICFNQLPDISLTALPMGTIVTITGKDYGNYLLAEKIEIIKPPSPSTHQYYLTRAETASKVALKEAVYDFVVSRDAKKIYLASGKTLNVEKWNFPVGSKIKITYKKDSQNIDIQIEEIGKMTIFKGAVSKLRKLDNGVLILNSDLLNNRIYIFPSNQSSLPDKGFLQGLIIQYPNMSIMVEYRIFELKSLSTTKGLITKIMDQSSMMLLDNGILMKTDDWTEIRGGSLGIGKTVQLFGYLEQGVFHTYVVYIEKENVMFSGVIVEFNLKTKSLKLDSGQVISWNNQTLFQVPLSQLKLGDFVYVRAYINDNTWTALEILSSRDESPEIGDNA